MPSAEARAVRQRVPEPSENVAALARAHLGLAQALDRLEEVTTAPQSPAAHVIAKIRYELAMAARNRRATVLALTSATAQQLGPSTSGTLSSLRTMQTQLDLYTSEYVRLWTVQRVASDWPSYRTAAAEKRRLVRDSIRLEKELLEPLLRAMDDPGEALKLARRTPLRAYG